MGGKGGQPPRQGRPKGQRLRIWKHLKFREILRGERAAKKPGRRGTPQRKVRWGRGGQLAARKRNKKESARSRARITKRVARRRRRKGRNHRHG